MKTILETSRFGNINYEDKDLVAFNTGVPGFPNEKQFVFINHKEGSPFKFMQSITNVNLTFIVADPYAFFKDYEFDLSKEVQKELELEKSEDVQVFVVVTVPQDPKNMTANLQAPIIINTKNGKAQQIILTDSNYSVKQPLVVQDQDKKGSE